MKRAQYIGILGLVFGGFYLMGLLFPDVWWTTHFLAFLTPTAKWVILLLSTGLLAWAFYAPPQLKVPKIDPSHSRWVMPLVALIMAVFMYQFPILADYYGDAYKLNPHLDQTLPNIPPQTHEAFFSLGFSPWDGHASVLAVLTYIAYFGGFTYRQMFLGMDALCGFFFIWLWLSFVWKQLEKTEWKWILSLMGISAPFVLFFFGHIESYAPVFLLFLLWSVLLVYYVEKGSQWYFWGLVLLLPICMKFHPVALLFMPSLGLLLIHQYARPESKWRGLLSWKGISRWLLLPILIIGLGLYFIVFQDHVDNRSLDIAAMEYDHLFLPLFSPEAPLDQYNMLSGNHLFDYFSEILVWSPIALFIFVAIILFHRKALFLNHLALLASGLNLLLLASLLFVINPLLSMQLDWDLMALPAPLFLVCVVLCVKQVSYKISFWPYLPISLALGLLSLPIFMIHQSEWSLSKRLESLGVRIYHSYYEWSSKTIINGLELPLYASREAYEVRKEALLKKLEPHVLKGRDYEYARLLLPEARYHLRTARNYERAQLYINKAQAACPDELNGLMYQMELHFLKKEFNQAFDRALDMIKYQFPSEEKAFTIAVQCALEAGKFDAALALSTDYVQKWNASNAVRQVYEGLSRGANTDSLRLLFAQPE